MPSPSRKKPAYHHGDLRRVLLEHAAALLDREGADALSLRDLAKLAKVSPAAPYRHFESKEALLAELAEEGFAELEARLASATATHADAPSRLLSLGKAYLDLALRRPHFFRMMFSADIGPSRANEGILRACDRVYLDLVELFRQGQAAKRLRGGSADEQALLYWSTLHGYAMLQIDRRFDDLGLSAAQHLGLLAKLLDSLFVGLAI